MKIIAIHFKNNIVGTIDENNNVIYYDTPDANKCRADIDNGKCIISFQSKGYIKNNKVTHGEFIKCEILNI